MKLDKWQGKWVQIIYLDRKGKFSHRTVLIKRVDGDYLIAYCANRKQSRRFKINNILAIQPVMSHAI